jgi:hypothetical protein
MRQHIGINHLKVLHNKTTIKSSIHPQLTFND